MKNFGKLFLVSCLALGLFACTKENEAPESESIVGANQVYMQFQLELPTLTRSQTDDPTVPGNGESNSNAKDDQEVGTAKENAVNSIQLVLLDEKDKVIAVSVPQSKDVTVADADQGLYRVAFQSEQLEAAAKEGAKTPVKLIAYVNCTAVSAIVGQPFVYNSKVSGLNNIAGAAGFYMTNANDIDYARADIPAKERLADYSDAFKAYPIGSVEVERTAARFDVSNAKLTFNVQPSEVDIELVEAAMFNVPNECYELRRVSANGDNISGLWEGLFGRETLTNYVVDLNAAEKKSSASEPAATPELLAKYTPNTAEGLEWTKLASLSGGDKWVGQDAEANGEYHFWRYAVENTYPGVKAFEDVSTGVVFKGALKANASAPENVKGAFNSKKPLFVLANVFYGTWEMVVAAATEEVNQEGVMVPKNKDLNLAYELVKAKLSEAPTAEEIEAAAKKEGFVVYKYNTTDKFYPVFYNYYNRHNDAYKERDGAMKHAVVRNNVYKLKVDTILRFGDPEFQKPKHKPIDQDEVFFKVTVKILPWTVRVNNIEF